MKIISVNVGLPREVVVSRPCLPAAAGLSISEIATLRPCASATAPRQSAFKPSSRAHPANRYSYGVPTRLDPERPPVQTIITFLGTAAANAFPEAFCSCRNCAQARIAGGRSLRKRSAALINDDLLIDLGPDIMAASQIHGRSLHQVRYCLQTHPHADHLDLSHLLSRSPAYGVVDAPVLEFYASRETLQRAAQTFERDLANFSLLSSKAEKQLNFSVHQIEPLERFKVGPYSVTAFPANHASGMGAMLYAIEANRRAIFYGTDTGPLFEETWQAFRERNMRFDVVILDHTYGPEQAGSDHLCAQQVIEHANRMRVEGILNQRAHVFATHVAHDGNPAHGGLESFATRHGYEVAYDGLVLEA